MIYLSLPEKLLSIIEKEARLYISLLGLSKQKTGVIISGDIKELENITKREQVLFKNVEKLEETREQVVSEIACSLGTESSTLTISSIIANLDKAWAERLKEARDSILSTIDEIRKINMQNKVLIDTSLEYIDFSLNLVSSTSSKGVSYSRNGKEGNDEKRSLFDVKL